MDISAEMTLGGWIFLVSAWVIIGAFTVYCFVKVLRLKATGD